MTATTNQSTDRLTAKEAEATTARTNKSAATAKASTAKEAEASTATAKATAARTDTKRKHMEISKLQELLLQDPDLLQKVKDFISKQDATTVDKAAAAAPPR
mmetsp:Transcript_2657/g.7261  ORF Transcript_2657/g.7261 Transcript_2657/m.7261 type:complete len:102 (-) Transcript_2657:272-577(-)